jgi:hypothetical protein
VNSPLDYLGNVTAPTRAKAKLALEFLLSRGANPTHFWGYDPNPRNPEHHARTAVDFMVFSDRAAGDALADWLWANRARLGLKHQIWRQRIRSTVTNPGVWRAMPDRGNPTENHMDHVHAMFFDSPVKSQPASALPSIGNVPGRFLTEDGIFDAGTVKVLQAFLSVKPADGIWGPMSKKAMQRWLRVTADGVVGPLTIRALNKKVGRPDLGTRWTRDTTRALEGYLNRGLRAGSFHL